MLRLVRQRQGDIPILAALQGSAAQDGWLRCEAVNNAKGEDTMGGFIGGLVAGVVCVLAMGAVLSMTAPLTRKPDVTTQAPIVGAAPEPLAGAIEDTARPDTALDKAAPSAPESPQGAENAVAALDQAVVSSDAQPSKGDDPSAPVTPEAPVEQAVSVQSDEPAEQSTPAGSPQTPQPTAEPELVENVPAPDPVEEEIAAAEPAQEEIVVEEVVREEPVQEEIAPQQPAEVVVEQVPDETPQPQIVAESVVEPEIALQDNPIAVEGEEDTTPREEPRVSSLPRIEADQDQAQGTLIGKRVVPLTERDDEETATIEPAPVAQASGKPIELHAAEFENPEEKPLMSIILIDDEGAFGAEALKDFPYPLSFAISPTDPDAAEKMARHRAAGFEVLAMTDLPAVASAQDAEVSLSVWLEMLPETVGILEGVETGIQGNRKLADQVASIAGTTGRGLITQDSGLNTVQKLAARNGIPSGVVFRDFDGTGQDAKVMRRFLDQAAFRAGQEGAVVMMGRVRPETISALLLWGLEDRDNRVALAPISAVMISQVPQGAASLEY